MKPTTFLGAASVALAVAACGATSGSPTASPTLALSNAPTIAPTAMPTTASTTTPTPSPTSCTPRGQGAGTLDAQCAAPVVSVASCDDSLVNANNSGGSISYTGVLADDELVIQPGDITVNPTGTGGTYGPLLKGMYTYQFRTSDGEDVATDGASGSFTIASCAAAPSWGFTTTCAAPGTAQGGSLIITFSNGTPATVVIDGNTVAVTSNPFTSGPYNVGQHSVILEGFNAPFNIPEC
ncbi:MAG TPA: hypothetical protein VMU65_09235 [Candidatus Saccharimonadales bacterium]|nr:hypothetical protein [Candidatus Saccharimonadales bacterium]